MAAEGVREIVLAGSKDRDLTKLAAYRAIGGYELLARAREMAPQALIDEFLAAGVRGRGGAGFPMGRKASFLAKGTGKPTYLTVNADESEPGTFKDREIMFRVPHRLIEGCLITAHAIESTNVFIYIRGEYLHEFEILRDALEEVHGAGLLDGVTIVLHRGAGAYICGEETGMLESLEGKRGQPRSKPPFPAVQGLYASPTLINNVETIATVPKILELGGAEYAKLGVENSAGTRVFSLSGNVVRGGNYELELGASLRSLIYDLGGGIPDGRQLKAVIPGGSSVPVLTADEVDTALDFDSMAQAGTMLGSGAVIVIDDRACMVQLGLRVAQFYMHESCGKCTPCREGTRWLVQILHAIEDGESSQDELELLLDVCDRILGKCLCPLGDAAAMPVASYVNRFREEFQRHIDEGGCPYGGASSLDHVLAPVDQHTGTPVPQEATA
ncbi:MAG: NADH-quinone oxidoreductase subunit NuoF [Actinobacteria bacterium]|nr:MAG: NADH-quinone oxidoreductase subunit NuoF [Actinomycetota bacterium]